MLTLGLGSLGMGLGLSGARRPSYGYEEEAVH